MRNEKLAFRTNIWLQGNSTDKIFIVTCVLNGNRKVQGAKWEGDKPQIPPTQSQYMIAQSWHEAKGQTNDTINDLKQLYTSASIIL